MKRLIIVLLWALLSADALLAQPLTRNEARQRAEAFVAERRAAARAAVATPAATLAETASPCSGLYVFNVGDDDGFVVVSAADRVTPVVAYAESGTFSTTTLPDNARAWLTDVALTAQDADDAEPVLGAPPTYPATAPVRPLLTTQWAQNWPYNRFCPNNSATGCVATAVAQVMKYYEWPQGETATIPAYGKYQSLEPVTFDWGNMLLGYGGDETTTQRIAVARLMQYCGYALQMSYGATSMAYSEVIADALHRFFGYDGAARLVYRSDFSQADWMQLICDELAAGRPVIYGGARSSISHQFVCDGYDGAGFYHINWGWGGLSDGWFRLTEMNPKKPGTGGGSGYDGYTMNQSAVVGVQPDRGGTTTPPEALLTCEELRLLKSTRTERTAVNAPFELRLCRPMINHSRDTLKMGYGLALMRDGEIVEGSEQLRSATTFVPGAFINRTLGWDYEFGSGLTGSYRIVPVCSMAQGKKTIVVPALGADSRYIDVELTETTLTATEHPRRALTVDDVTFTLRDGIIDAKATVTNHGDDYDGLLYLLISGVRVAYMGVSIAAGTTDVMTFRYQRRWTEQEYQIGYTGEDTEWLAEGTGYYTTENTAGTFVVWYAGGRKERLPMTDDRAVVPPSAVAVEFDGGVPTTIVRSSNPNCIYYTPSDSEGTDRLTNVVKNNYTAELTLDDGYDFYCPMAFTAGRVAYTRTFAQGYDGEGGGWDTIILPFEPTSITAGDGRTLDWFRSAGDKDKDFWLMTLDDGSGAALTFGHAQRMEPNRPYLVAVPGDVYGERSLAGSSVTFAADHAVINETYLTTADAGDYRFVGSFGQEGLAEKDVNVGSNTVPQAFKLSAAGNRFAGSVSPAGAFRVALRRR